jgi:recombination protein RecA
VRSNAVDVIVIDSVAALVPKAELEGEMGDSFVGLQARLMSQALRKLTGATAQSKTCLIFINQLREKIGVMFGSPETTTGGKALKFYCSVRIDIRRIGQIKNGDEVVGNRTKATVVKNKLAPPFRKVEFDILFGKGINLAGDVLDLAVEKNVVQKSGTWYAYGEIKLGQGRDRAVELFNDNPELLAKVQKEVLAKALPVVVPATGAGSKDQGSKDQGARDQGARDQGARVQNAAASSSASGSSASGSGGDRTQPQAQAPSAAKAGKS